MSAGTTRIYRLMVARAGVLGVGAVEGVCPECTIRYIEAAIEPGEWLSVDVLRAPGVTA